MMTGEIDDLRLFLRLVAAGGLSEAARRLHSSPPAMSRRLAAMETRLGVRLIERTSRRFVLTEEGTLLHERAQRIVADIDTVEAELSAMGGTPTGQLRIGAPMEIGRRRIAPLIGEFRKRYPKVACELVLSDAGLDVTRDELDFAFRTTKPEELGVTSLPFLSSRRVVCAAPSYLARHGAPSRPRDLADHDCLRLVRGRWMFDRWQFAEAGKTVEMQVQGSLASTSGEVIHGWVLDGQGIALKAEWDIADDLRDGSLIECLADFSCDRMHLYGICLTRDHQPLRLRVFVDFVRQGLLGGANNTVKSTIAII